MKNQGNIIISQRPLSDAVEVLKELGHASAHYLSNHYIDASPFEIGYEFRTNPCVEPFNNSENSRKIWKYVGDEEDEEDKDLETLLSRNNPSESEPLKFEEIKTDAQPTVSGYGVSVSDDGVHTEDYPFSERLRDVRRGSTKKQKDGRKPISLKRKWGLIRCGGPHRRVNKHCPALLIVRDGQRTKKCHLCSHRRSLGRKRVLAVSDKQDRIRGAKNLLESSGYYRTLGDLDVQLQ